MWSDCKQKSHIVVGFFIHDLPSSDVSSQLMVGPDPADRLERRLTLACVARRTTGFLRAPGTI
jgi:hypothetical protein